MTFAKPGMLMALLALAPIRAMAEDTAEKDACFPMVTPVVSLEYGSRYTDDSKTRSDFDEKSNAEVDKALGPVDDFITDLVRESNRAMTRKESRATRSADCVLDHLEQWAGAGAFSELKTEAVRISIASRLSGIAFAYANVLPLASEDKTRKDLIEAWLRAQALATMAFFDNEAPPRASANNLRAWAGLAVTRIGLTLQDETMLAWGDASFRKVLCDLNPDGSLPREMERGRLALHYQLHALGPLVMTAALLEQDRQAGLFDACDKALPRSIDFTLAALREPELAAAHAGVDQTFSGENPETLKPYDIAWATAYLRFVEDEELKALAATFETLGNSKYGGSQKLLWAEPEPEPEPKPESESVSE